MFHRHTTKNGESILVCQMDDRHLWNTLKMYCRKIKAARKVLEGKAVPVDPILGAVIGEATPIEQHTKARQELMSSHHALMHFVIEAAVRDFDVQSVLQDAYGRDQGLNRPTVDDNEDENPKYLRGK